MLSHHSIIMSIWILHFPNMILQVLFCFVSLHNKETVSAEAMPFLMPAFSQLPEQFLLQNKTSNICWKHEMIENVFYKTKNLKKTKRASVLNILALQHIGKKSNSPRENYHKLKFKQIHFSDLNY